MPKVKVTTTNSGVFAAINCPGCGHAHSMPVKKGPAGSADMPLWEFDMDLEKPTFRPSLLCNKPGAFHHEGSPVCHSWITKGRIQYLPDSTHDLRGQTIDLPDYPEEWT